ncbi:SDR family NAD(P)-dependent oxidoreductase [uncultured Pleomorphomonas sp.]|uniref:SDR family NAD(P)-dependent oxidoreductase n=1 Tax=uncultured Pleomorphomonas sp. TaxID=442121 RepID=UPI0025830FA3|nr:SDR family NAD(P)-dependent oxidoreductase [uncultured Pleomorphomonas sp.]
MDLQLKGKRALVTGSTSGIGAEITRMLAAEGADVVVHGRDQSRARQVVAEIEEAAGGRVAFALGDLSSSEGANAVAKVAQETFGGIDILVNNAGGSNTGGQRPAASGWLDTSADYWVDTFNHNTIAVVRLVQALAPAMRERGWGRIIQISSRNAIAPRAEAADYSAAKGAVNNLTLSLSKALAGTGVTSNAIMPGLIHTALADPFFEALAKQQGSDDLQVGIDFAVKNILQQTVARVGQPRDIAAAVCFVASPLSDFMTGAIIRIDGGATPAL